MLSLQDYRFEWLTSEQLPLAGKFYQHHGIRGKVGRRDQCAVLRQPDSTIVAIAVIKQKDQYNLLNHVAVIKALRRKGLASHLLSLMACQFNTNTYCFPFTYLETLYMQHGFVKIKESQALDTVVKRFQVYVNHGRDILLMRYQVSDDSIKV